MDPFFAENLAQRQESWRRVVSHVSSSRAVLLCSCRLAYGAAVSWNADVEQPMVNCFAVYDAKRRCPAHVFCGVS